MKLVEEAVRGEDRPLKSTMKENEQPFCNGWLAFELTVLRRLRFHSVAIPFTGEPNLSAELKRWKVAVATNDESRWSFIKSKAFVENNAERLSATDIDIVLEDAYVPQYKLSNPNLLNWFNETDAIWFDNVRTNVEKLGNATQRAIALSLGMSVGDYALSFDDRTRSIRRPFSKVFQRLWERLAPPINNQKDNVASNLDARTFVAEQHADLLFLRLPSPKSKAFPHTNSIPVWREDWIRGNNRDNDKQLRSAGRLGAVAETKQQYLQFVEQFLERALHLPLWAILHVEEAFLSTAELVESVRAVRKVDTVYTKDFTEMQGVRASIITAKD